jgi:hypothetical protein
MANIIPFGSKSVSTVKRDVSINDDLISGGGGFPKLSIKGKVFALVRSGERKVITRPDDPDTAASSLEVVLLRTQKGFSKAWYLKPYVEGQEVLKPDCSSRDGVKPDESITDPQAKSCANCPHNQFGSARQGKGKACADIKRVAVAAPDRMDEPMLLQIPPGSFKNLTQFGKDLKAHGAQYNEVVTRIGFNMEAATPELTFKPLGYLDKNGTAEAAAKYHDDAVQQIIGLLESDEDYERPQVSNSAEVAKAISATETTDEDEDDVADPVSEAVVEQAEKAVSAAKATKVPKEKKPEPAVEIDDDGLAELLSDFDD